MDTKTVAREFWASYSTGDIAGTWERFVAEDVVIHPSSGFEFTRETWKAAEEALIAAFDDVNVEVLDQIAEGNKVATYWVLSGTQKTEFMGVPSQGKTAKMTAMTVDVIRDGKIVEHYGEVGVPRFLGQLSGT